MTRFLVFFLAISLMMGISVNAQGQHQDLLEVKLTLLETVVQQQGQIIEEQGKIIHKLKTQIDRLEEMREVRQPIIGRSVAADAANYDGNAQLSSFEGMPTSCQDLSQLGHALNGFYTVKGPNGILTVYCDFRKTPRSTGFQTSIGYSKAVSSPVYFNVGKTGITTTPGVIKWTTARTNIGNAMDTTTGIFTAPRAGVYFFLFSGIKDYQEVLMIVDLLVNGAKIARSWSDNQPYPLTATIHSTLTLKAGDKVSMTLVTGGLYDNFADFYTCFSGWLLEENVFE